MSPVCRKAQPSANSKYSSGKDWLLNFIVFIKIVTSLFPSIEILVNFVSKVTNRATSRCFAVMVSAKKFLCFKKNLFNLMVHYLF